ncbi:4-hydroxy-tetrahydrodipicolinate synthase [Candidatus Bathyarchaeota archaeon]|nr:4-hydroxy-tetrahydrodipicolinate synthase [Candidatus Bathyarchaeota archaeon]
MKPEGIFVPNVTPFNGKGEIIFDALGNLVEYWIENGVSGIVANASTGEGPYLSMEEKAQVIEYIIEKADGRVSVFAGSGSMSTWETIQLTREALDLGAEAALITTPFFFKPRDEEIRDFFIDVTSSVDIPVILYNVPKFTGYSVSPSVVSDVVDECSNLVAIKDSSGNPGNMSEVIRLCGDKINALSGSADMILPTLMLGGKGAIVAVGNIIPHDCVSLYRAFKKNDMETSGKLQSRASLVNKVLVRENPQIAAIKAALGVIGYHSGHPRKPLLPLSEDKIAEIRSSLKL